MRNAAARAVRGPSGSKHPNRIIRSWIYLPFYVSRYHVQRNDAMPGGVLCDSPLYFVSRVINKLESIFGSSNRT